MDRSRDEPFVDERQSRELMVQLWYPAAAGSQARAPCLEAGAARDWEQAAELSAGLLGKLRVHARAGAEVADGGPYPVVLYSPGYASGRGFGTALVQELVSRGYVVVAMDHPYDTAVVEFPGGRLVPAKPVEVPEGADPRELSTWDALTKPYRTVRVADVRFVLDALNGCTRARTRMRSASACPVGSPTAWTCPTSACSATRWAAPPLRRRCWPIGAFVPAAIWTARCRRRYGLLGWHLDLRLTGAGHNSFTDQSVFCRQLGDTCPEQWRAMVGSIDGDTAVVTQRAYITAFFDQHFKGERQAILKRPSKRYPEVEFLD